MNVYLADFPGKDSIGYAVIIAATIDDAESILEEQLIEDCVATDVADVEWTIFTGGDDEPILAFFDAGEMDV